jgi:hypothetical protein
VEPRRYGSAPDDDPLHADTANGRIEMHVPGRRCTYWSNSSTIFPRRRGQPLANPGVVSGALRENACRKDERERGDDQD